jgi:hypothetical protein
MDLLTLLSLLKKEGDLTRIARDPFVQFGSEIRRKTYLGARFFPEVLQTKSKNNIIVEEEVRFRTIIAEDSGRYDPAVKREFTESVSTQVAMGHFDAKRSIDGPPYDAIIEMLSEENITGARSKMISLIDTMIKYALLDKKEKQRWEAIVNSVVNVNKANGQSYTVAIDAPAGNRVVSPSFFTDNAFDPLEEIFKGVDVLKSLGYGQIQAAISTYAPLSAMRSNAIVQRRTGGMTVDTINNAVYPVTGATTNAQINQILSQQGIPPITEYNNGYNTEAGFFPFIPKDAFILIASTPREQTLVVPDGNDMLMYNTLGYYGVGLCQGETAVGDVIKLFPREEKPVHIDAEGQGVGFPVPQEEKAIYVIRGCVPA